MISLLVDPTHLIRPKVGNCFTTITSNPHLSSQVNAEASKADEIEKRPYRGGQAEQIPNCLDGCLRKLEQQIKQRTGSWEMDLFSYKDC